MPSTRDEILEAAMHLSEDDRLEIIDRLMETLPDELPGLSDNEPDLQNELLRRSRDRDGAVVWDVLRNETHTP
jgi:hypothetical protein